MSVLCLNVCILCVPNIMSLGRCFKKLHLIKVGAFAWYSVKIRAIFGVRFQRRKKLIKKQRYVQIETWKLYSRVFWTSEPNFIKIDPFHFELYRFIVGAFLRRSVHAQSIAQHRPPTTRDNLLRWHRCSVNRPRLAVDRHRVLRSNLADDGGPAGRNWQELTSQMVADMASKAAVIGRRGGTGCCDRWSSGVLGTSWLLVLLCTSTILMARPPVVTASSHSATRCLTGTTPALIYQSINQSINRVYWTE